MYIEERIKAFTILFNELQETNSRTEKETIVAHFEWNFPELKEDWYYILETLDNKHPIGWTFVPRAYVIDRPLVEDIKEMIQLCEYSADKTQATTSSIERYFGRYGTFLAPIVNRTLRLGIGKSLLSKTDITPMLAKKYEGGILPGDVTITEKLDGNRCIARYDGEKWCFTSRSGKPMKVNFDMTGMNTDLIYDGEVMSTTQTELSHKRHMSILNDNECFDFDDMKQSQLLFNETSGLINRHGNKTGLVYNIFDIVSDDDYPIRRFMLTDAYSKAKTNDIRILPVLYEGHNIQYINLLLDKVTRMGGEGIMLNKNNRGYEHKRSDALLKYKKVQTIDMMVIGTLPGTGKYEGLVGALHCHIHTNDGKDIVCDVGSGLSDAQRLDWEFNCDDIIGKIVQIGYHELTQSKDEIGTNIYSLRFPRLMYVRNDKTSTSEY